MMLNQQLILDVTHFAAAASGKPKHHAISPRRTNAEPQLTLSIVLQTLLPGQMIL
jgi:hypothetical protein